MAMTLQQFLDKQKENPKLDEQGTPCSKCGKKINYSTGQERLGSGNLVCSDCYFEMWGDEIEKHPIISPGIKRGV